MLENKEMLKSWWAENQKDLQASLPIQCSVWATSGTP